MQQAIGADRAHLGDIDPEQQVDVGGQRQKKLLSRIGRVPRLMAISHRHDVTLAHRRRAGLDDLSYLHVSQKGNRIPSARRARDKNAVSVVPPGAEVGVRALHEGELGSGGEPREQRADAELALLGRAFLIAEEK